MEGKETLVKSVLQAVGTYPMGCFQLSEKMCGSLTSIASHFWWWGAADGKRKVHWISWNKMCAPKRTWGMGFRNYSAFNQALLAKQAWRMVTNPESLCARVLRARYFQEGFILIAKCPKGASYTWRSIIHGRDLLREGVIWRIGSGVGIDVWADNWIPREGLKRPLGLRPNKHVSSVDELLLSDGQGWNADKLNELFFEGDVEDILKIPVGRAGTENYIAWNYTKNGIFTVKSAYHLKMKLKEQAAGRAGPSNGCDGHRGWLALWGAEVPGKARIHVWRMIKNGLAVGTELQHRRVKDCLQQRGIHPTSILEVSTLRGGVGGDSETSRTEI
jgi:hypothetical protein